MTLRFRRRTRLQNDRPHADPYFEWARANRFAHLARGRWFQVLLGFSTSERARRFARQFPRPGNAKVSRRTNLWIPSAYAQPPAGLETTRFCTAIVRRQFLENLNSNWASRRGIRRVQLGNPIDLTQARVIAPGLPNPPPRLGAARRAVVTGIIDDGLAIAHERFRGRNGSRIEFFWDQVEPNAGLGPWYGYELRKDTVNGIPGIDDWLLQCTHQGLVDEDEFYRVTGMVDFSNPAHKSSAQRASHGTHVMDIACGFDPNAAPLDRPIVCVQLPVRTTEDTSGATLAPQVLDALWYIADRAGRRPLVVNLSYGLMAGPHDGTGDLEAAINEFVSERNRRFPTAVVLPSGNGSLVRGHACFCLKDSASKVLHWRVQPEDLTESLLDIWLRCAVPGEAQPNLVVEVVAPDGQTSGPIQPGFTSDISVSNYVVGRVTNYAADQTGHDRARIYIGLAATASHDPAFHVAPSGIWQVRLTNAGNAVLHDIHAWIQRDDNAFGYPRRGRQSCFEDPDYLRFDQSGREIERDENDDPAAYVKRDGTISAMATGGQAIVIGGYRRSDGHPVKYSAGGPPVPPARGAPNPAGPDALAVSEDSVACHGVLAAGSRSGSSVAINGTSIAAPSITRFVADEMAANRPGTRQAVFDAAQTQEAAPPRWAEAVPPAKRGGGGRFLPLPHQVPIPVSRRVGER